MRNLSICQFSKLALVFTVVTLAPAQSAMSDDDSQSSGFVKKTFSAPILENGKLTSHYGVRKDPFTKNAVWHAGVDVAQRWEAPISAPADGEIVFADQKKGYGRTVDVKLVESGSVIRFAHLHSINVVEGQLISAGEVVGLMGGTGRASGPYVHVEYRQNGRQYDPSNVPGLRFSKRSE